MSSEKTFAPEDQQQLATSGELIEQNKRVKVSIHRMNQRSSDDFDSAIVQPMSSPKALTSVGSISSVDDFIDVPAELESKETYEYLGFDTWAAAAIWEIWQLIGAFDKETFTDFFSFSQGWLDGHCREDASCETDDWDACLTVMGLNSATKAAIMDPEFKAVRLTGSAKGWAKDTMSSLYEHLGQSSRASRQRVGSSTNGSSLSYAVASGPTFASPPGAPGHTTLWKACATDRARAMWTTTSGPGFILSPIISSFPGDILHQTEACIT